jgi:hypothetical protein
VIAIFIVVLRLRRSPYLARQIAKIVYGVLG